MPAPCCQPARKLNAKMATGTSDNAWSGYQFLNPSQPRSTQFGNNTVTKPSPASRARTSCRINFVNSCTFRHLDQNRRETWVTRLLIASLAVWQSTRRHSEPRLHRRVTQILQKRVQTAKGSRANSCLPRIRRISTLGNLKFDEICMKFLQCATIANVAESR